MARWIKISFTVFGILFLITTIGWLALAAYFQSHKGELLKSITTQLNDNLNGTLTIEKMEPALIRGFPGVSVTLKNIVLHDKLWYRHRHDVLNASEAYISVDAFSIFKGSPTIKNITINNGKLYFYTDSSGYSNTDLFQKDTMDQSQDKSSRKRINKVELRNVTIIVDHVPKSNYFSFEVKKFDGIVNYNAKGWTGKANFNTRVKTLAFNTRLGSFLKNKMVKTELKMSFNDQNKQLTIPSQTVEIANNKFKIGARFNFSDSSSDFGLDIKSNSISFKDVRELFSPNISSKLKFYELKEPLSANATIRGSLKAKHDPKIIANWKVQNNTLVANGETITDCSFNGSYINESVLGKGFTDTNSIISFYSTKGKWHDIPFSADSITLTNLKRPVLTGKFMSAFALTKLNSIFGDQTFSFSNGNAMLNLNYKAPYFSKDQSQKFINGNIQISNASLKYLPRNLPFKNVRATLNFSGQNLFLRNTNVQSGGSSLQMEGSIKNFLNLYYTDPKKMQIDLGVKSPQINLGQFLSFLERRRSGATATNVNKISRQIDRMLNEASVHMNMKVDKLIYKKFIARNVNSNLTLRQQGIGINDVSLSHAGGSLRIFGEIDQSGPVNKVNLKTRIIDADIQQLFFAFNNFGQTGITEKNLRGVFTADCNISGSLKDNGDVVPRSIRGTVFFNLKNGALLNFEPMERIGSMAFANRDFSNITFKNLSNTFSIRDNSISIPPMQIESSVINIFLEGIYGFSSGTNIAMQVPLRNPKKDEFIVDQVEKVRRSKKGIVINLRAIAGTDGKVKFKLGKD
ncbi:MAG: AsmA family protein [Flavobacterium sp.]|nr:AsmA family protein [Pedobacter sp.]